MLRNTISGLFAVALLTAGCGREPRDLEQIATDIVSARTVGLAYLEENRLEEAEAEFAKLVDLAPDEAIGYANLGLVFLRMGRYPEAEQQLNEALSITPDAADILLLLAKVQELSSDPAQAIRILEQSLETTPNHIKSLYAVADLHGRSGAENAASLREEYLTALVGLAPANLAARMQLVEVLVRVGKADSAVAAMESVRQRLGELPREAVDFFAQALQLLRSGDTESALTPTVIVHNFLRITPLYQAGLIDLQGPGGAAIGFPVITFHQNLAAQAPDQAAVLAALHFTDATETAGLSVPPATGAAIQSGGEVGGRVAVADYDADGDDDLLLVGPKRDGVENTSFLFRNDFGRFTEVAADAGLDLTEVTAGAIFADFDNDGALDLHVVTSGANILFRNVGDGRFRDVGRRATIAGDAPSRLGSFLDVDQDGDLDLFTANNGENRLYRNNLDGTFAEMSDRMGLAGPRTFSRDATFGDFDEDGDLDLFVVNVDSEDALYSNLRQGSFENLAAAGGVEGNDSSSAVAVGDYDNDGFLDLFVASFEAGSHSLYRNLGDGTFEPDSRATELLTTLGSIRGFDADFLDFDNDGYLDLVFAGRSEMVGERGLRLFHNDGPGQFSDVSEMLPDGVLAGESISLTDYNEDGDVDIVITDEQGRLRLLRNDGGNANRYLNVTLVGLTTGSGKNNHFGIGAKLEVRAGDLYQTRVVTSELNHFGLGPRLKADVVRIVWTNGVPQNIFFPGSDQDLVEQQILKGSCGLVHAWDGEKFSFVKDIVWRSALGMPLGIMGGSETYGSPHASQEYIRIPGEQLKERNGTIPVRITEELWETLYLDQVELIAVDHPDTVDVFVDERFAPTSAERTPLRLFKVAEKILPVSATDDRNNDILSQISEKDDVYVSDFVPTRFQGVTELHDLILDLGHVAPTDSVLLFLNGWIFPTDASINVAMGQSDEFESVSPYLQVIDGSGHWRTVIDNISFPMGKDKNVVVDLSDKFITNDHRVRIRTNMEVYWDHVFFSRRRSRTPIKLTTMTVSTGDLHYRGFSRTYRKGGRYGPHWFDYGQVSHEPRWRDLEGLYTRFGDVHELLLEPDEQYVIMNAGDEVSIEFNPNNLPDIAPGWTRDYLIYTFGWLKDGDLNTAAGQTVEPLPFRGMTQYPYGVDEAYPTDVEHQEYLRRYNTRRVTADVGLSRSGGRR